MENLSGIFDFMVTIYLIRHGETEENARGIFQGQTPGTLSQLGKAQAATLCEPLSQLHFDAVYCSDLQRCKDTAAIALSATTYQPIYTTLLRERDMGNLVGRQIAGSELNDTVESAEACSVRARRLLQMLRDNHDGQTVLLVSHGYFCRIIQSVLTGIDHQEIPLMRNCELKKLMFS